MRRFVLIAAFALSVVAEAMPVGLRTSMWGAAAVRRATTSPGDARTPVPVPKIEARAYDGTARAVDEPEDSSWTVSSGDGGVDVGVHEVTLRLADPQSTRWGDGKEGAARTLTWAIVKRTLTDDMVGDIEPQLHTGAAITPEPLVEDDGCAAAPARGKDYEISYSGNVAVGIATVTVTGKGNYSGSVTRTFRIVTQEMVTLAGLFGGLEAISADGDGGLIVTLAGDIEGTVELTNDLGNVTIDLNGHDITGSDGGAAIHIVAGEGGSTGMSLAIEDLFAGDKGRISGDGDGMGIEIDEEATHGIRLKVFDEVAVLNGDGAEQALEELILIENSLVVGRYFKATLAEMWYDVPTDGRQYGVVAKGLPAGLKLRYNAAVKNKKGKVVTKAKTTWWIEGVPTKTLDYRTNPPYLVITVNGVAETYALSLEVLPQEITQLGDLALGRSVNTNGWLSGVGKGWSVSGLPTGLKFATKKVTKKSGKKKVTVANAYAVYGKTTKAGLYTITAKKKKNGYYETKKFQVLVTPKTVDEAIFTDSLTNITTMAYVPIAWNLVNGNASTSSVPSVSSVPFVPSSIGGKLTKVTGLPKGLSFAAKNTYAYKNAKKKKGKYLKQYGQTIVGTPTKPGTYVVTFTKNVKTKVGKKTKTVKKTAQILWTVVENDAELELGFNTEGGVVETGSVGLKYDELLAFTATSNANVTASGLPKGMSLVRVDGSAGGLALPGLSVWEFHGFTKKAGTYLVTVKATLNGKSEVQRIAFKVDALPSWAKGTFNGYVSSTGGLPIPGGGENAQAARSTNGLATVTISSVGKISGKFQELGTNWTLIAACYTARTRGSASLPESQQSGGSRFCATDAFTCTNVIAKYTYKVTEKVKGKKTKVTRYLTREFMLTVEDRRVEDNAPYQGVVTLTETGGSQSPATEITAWQNLWGQADYKALGKKLFTTKSKKKTLAYTTITIKGTDDDGVRLGLGEGDTLTLKITTKGVVTATLKHDTGRTAKNKKTKKLEKVYYKPTCSTAVIPTSAPDAEEFTGEVILYFVPNAKNGFDGYAGTLSL